VWSTHDSPVFHTPFWTVGESGKMHWKGLLGSFHESDGTYIVTRKLVEQE